MTIISEDIGVTGENLGCCFNSRTFKFNKWGNEILRGWGHEVYWNQRSSV